MEHDSKKDFKYLFRKVKSMRQDIFSLKDNPEKIARGFALGSFISMTPFVGLHLVVSVGLASLFKWNRIAAGIAAFNTNIVTGIFIFSFNYYLGSKIIGGESDFAFPEHLDLSFLFTLIYSGSDVFLSLVVGGIITGISSAFVSYGLVKKIISKRNRLVVKQ
jgi:uncharacterized protein (DUF2062 family)